MTNTLPKEPTPRRIDVVEVDKDIIIRAPGEEDILGMGPYGLSPEQRKSGCEKHAVVKLTEDEVRILLAKLRETNARLDLKQEDEKQEDEKQEDEKHAIVKPIKEEDKEQKDD